VTPISTLEPYLVGVYREYHAHLLAKEQKAKTIKKFANVCAAESVQLVPANRV